MRVRAAAPGQHAVMRSSTRGVGVGRSSVCRCVGFGWKTVGLGPPYGVVIVRWSRHPPSHHRDVVAAIGSLRKVRIRYSNVGAGGSISPTSGTRSGTCVHMNSRDVSEPVRNLCDAGWSSSVSRRGSIRMLTHASAMLLRRAASSRAAVSLDLVPPGRRLSPRGTLACVSSSRCARSTPTSTAS
jgi:hypothetical protein